MSAQKVLLVLPFVAMMLIMANAKGLQLGFYKYSCPDAEKIVQQVTDKLVKRDPTLAAGLIRLNFHDCIVRGCDASVLLNPTKANNQTEKVAFPNLSLRGFEVIDAIKTALEKKCPRKVSCADILNLATRDAIQSIKGPWWEVPTGRRDGKISLASEANANLPAPFSNITLLTKNFNAVGLNKKDLVVLSGAHTIGIGHCIVISNRLYNFTGKGDSDPAMSPSYVAFLKTKCKPLNFTSFVPMDNITPNVFDHKYYTVVSQKRGLFTSDATLLDDSETKNYVQFQAKSQGATFAKDFAKSMLKMIKIGVLTGSQGEVRKSCGFVN